MRNTTHHGLTCSSRGSEYSTEQREFLTAIDRYKRTNHRPFPTWTELLGVIKDLGYRRPGFDEQGNRQ